MQYYLTNTHGHRGSQTGETEHSTSCIWGCRLEWMCCYGKGRRGRHAESAVRSAIPPLFVLLEPLLPTSCFDQLKSIKTDKVYFANQYLKLRFQKNVTCPEREKLQSPSITVSKNSYFTLFLQGYSNLYSIISSAKSVFWGSNIQVLCCLNWPWFLLLTWKEKFGAYLHLKTF